MRRIPRALAAAALVGIVAAIPLSTGAADAAPPAKCPAFNLTTAAKAPVVVHARVIGATKKTGKSGALIVPTSVMTTLRGAPVTKMNVTLNPGPCQQKSLVLDEDYYFFVTKTGASYVASGTTPQVAAYTDALEAQVSKLFPGHEPPPPPIPQAVQFGKAQLDDVSSMATLAGPGIALVGIGVLGFLVVWLVGRRTTAV